MNKWKIRMKKWMKWRKERINELKNEKVNERINKWKIGWMKGWINYKMGG